MAEPGTKVVSEDTRVRSVDGVEVSETTIRWNGTERVSVDYRAAGVEMYDDGNCSFDGPLDDDELRELLREHGLLAPAG